MAGDYVKDWEQLGAADPYFAVLTNQRFQRENLSEDALRDFFTSGQHYIDFLFQLIRTHLDVNFQPVRTLDFGCGVGRLTVPLSANSTSVVACDASVNMLLEAKRNCEARGISNVEFVRSDDYLSEIKGPFDFINSFIVFQHIPRRKGERLVQALLERLQDNGIGALHFTYHKATSGARKFVKRLSHSVRLIHWAVNLLEGRPFNYPMIQMNEYDLNKLCLILQRNNCHHCLIRFTRHSMHHGALLVFQKKHFDSL